MIPDCGKGHDLHAAPIDERLPGREHAFDTLEPGVGVDLGV